LRQDREKREVIFMQHPYAMLASEYAALLAAMRVDPARENDLARRAAAVLRLANQHRDEWAEVTAKTGVPRLWGIASFERESSSDYSCSPAQGDRWDRVSIHVPRGLGPYPDWGDSCVAAYGIDKLDEVGASNWIWTRACYEGELYNGFGPRANGRHTGYLWSWTNIYTAGKYVEDGKWNPDVRDLQCGMVPMMAALLRLDASLALPVPSLQSLASEGGPQVSPPEVPPPANVPAAVGGEPAGGDVTEWLQTALNKLGADPPLVVDGSYGRHTRRAVAAFQTAHELIPDGLAGPLTLAALHKLTDQK
jgi:lysozyme family protein